MIEGGVSVSHSPLQGNNGRWSSIRIQTDLPTILVDGIGSNRVEARIKHTCNDATEKEILKAATLTLQTSTEGETTVVSIEAKVPEAEKLSYIPATAANEQEYYARGSECRSLTNSEKNLPEKRRQVEEKECKKGTATGTVVATTEKTSSGSVTATESNGITTDVEESSSHNLLNPLSLCSAAALTLSSTLRAASASLLETEECRAFVEIIIFHDEGRLISGYRQGAQYNSAQQNISISEAVPGRAFIDNDVGALNTHTSSSQGSRGVSSLENTDDLCACSAQLVQDAVDERRALGPDKQASSEWLHQAVGEHSSIASFAAHTLQLMVQGAPSSLLAAASRAAGDEVRHADACFAMAQAADISAPQVDKFPHQGIDNLKSQDLESLTMAALREGAIGETFSTLQAAVQAEKALSSGQPKTAALWRAIATDESRHAALAWRTLAWAISKDASLLVPLNAAIEEQKQIADNNHNPLYSRFVEKLLIPLAEQVLVENVDANSILNRAADNDRRATQKLRALTDAQSSGFVIELMNSIVENVVN